MDVFLDDPVLKMLLDYKAKYFIDEVFAELGLEIVERKKDGGAILRKIEDTDFIQ